MKIQEGIKTTTLHHQEHFPMLSDLTDDERDEIGPIKVIPRGTAIATEGQTCQYLPLLLQGEVRVFRIAENGRELSFSKLVPGQACVLVANCILQGQGFPAFAVAESELRVIMVPARLVPVLMERHPSWKVFIWSLMSNCVSSVISVAEEVVCHSLEQRIARYLKPHNNGVVLKRTHEHIAREINSTREVVSRALKGLEKRGIVKLGRGRVTILDQEKLASVW